jgi:hypothetical protein
MLACASAAIAAAQDDAPAPPPGPPEGAGPRRAVIEQFDADGDGALDDEEVGRARAFLQALRGEIGDRMRARREARGERDGDPPAAEGAPSRADDASPRAEDPRGDRPRRDRRFRERGGRPPLADAPPGLDVSPGPGGPPRPEGPPPRDGDPMRLFERFDRDGNGELNRREFAQLMGALAERRGRPGGRPEGPRFGPGRGPDGLPPGPPDGGGGPAFGRPEGPPPDRADGDRGARRFRPRDGERPRRPASDDASTDLPEAPPFDPPADAEGV